MMPTDMRRKSRASEKNQNSTAVQPDGSSLSQFETKQITLARVLFHVFRLHGRESRGAE
jgi:hypothetical protein